MQQKAIWIGCMLATIGLSGCFGFNGGTDFVPGEGFEPTGRTIHLEATVLDLLDTEVYPGLNVNFWAFCFRPKDPNHQPSVDAIEYFEDSTADVADASWQGTCSVPGPTLRVQQGDLVKVDFINNHVHHHTIHWHGQHVPWESDGVPGSTQDSVQAGELFPYEFIAKRAGTLWYHCHVDTQLHVMQGLYGVIIVEPQDQSMEPKDIDRDQVLVISTLRRELMENTPARQDNPHIDHQHLGGCGETGQPGCQNPPVDVDPDTFMINGQSFPNTLSHQDGLVELAPDERVRLRILNAGFTFETLHPHGHDLLITHVDGNPVPPDARVWKDSVEIGPGQRVDVVIEGREGNEGVWVFHTHVTSHVTNDGMYPGGMLTKIVYPEYLDDMSPFAGELPGGLPYIPPIDFPDDVLDTTKFARQTAQNAEGTWSFDVPKPCAIKSFVFSVDVEQTGGAVGPLGGMNPGNALQVRINDPSGNEFQTIDVGDSAYGEYRFRTEDTNATNPFKQGEYNVDLSGPIVESSVKLDLWIDHIDDAQEHKEFGVPCGTDGHGNYHIA